MSPAEIDATHLRRRSGQPQNTSAAALQTVSGNNGGYLLVTGRDQRRQPFVLKKYFLQILAGINNADVVLDPTGWLVVGQQQRIPFSLTETDRCVDVILLTDAPQAVRFTVETPAGEIIDPAVAQGRPDFAHVIDQHVAYYRLTLPADIREDHPEIDGTWTAVLEIPGRVGDGPRTHLDPAGQPTQRGRLPYSLLVHSWSDIALSASTDPTEPRARRDGDDRRDRDDRRPPVRRCARARRRHRAERHNVHGRADARQRRLRRGRSSPRRRARMRSACGPAG